MTDQSGTADIAAYEDTDDAEVVKVLAAVRHCANSWDGTARLVGNVRARDISRACTAAIASLQPATPTAGEPVAWRTRWKTGSERDREWEMWTYRTEQPVPNEAMIIEPLYSATGGDAVTGDAKERRSIADYIANEHACGVDIKFNDAEVGIIVAALRSDVAGDVQAARARNAAIEECAALMRRWRDDADEFKDERCRQQANLCQNAATAISNLAAKTPDAAQPSSDTALREAAKKVLDANFDFRNGLPEDWEGDPLQDACDELMAALAIPSTQSGCGDPNCKDPNCTYGEGPNLDPLSRPERKS